MVQAIVVMVKEMAVLVVVVIVVIIGIIVLGVNHMFLLVNDIINKQMPELVILDNPVSVSCGENHSFALCKNGLYAMGSNRFGQLGISNLPCNRESKLLVPTLVKFHKSHEVKKVECGEHHTFILTGNEIFGFGNNQYGQLGTGDNINVNRPKKVAKKK